VCDPKKIAAEKKGQQVFMLYSFGRTKSSPLGRVDAVDPDEADSESQEGSVIARGFLAS
jgi:hypothetical protein